ncbi:putative carbonic anhydrase 3 [Drosophila novamexicana]|uniref:putative carbonic anhydrase 3 n=1 Tax=Drosophila novamexicana TaxID=47314 RepID=UPI0011E59990|nr:putative carbonic anhydrase 3 [Drosophila novamexicana]
MFISRCWGLELWLQFLLLAVLNFTCCPAYIQLSNEYINDLRADEAAEQASGEYNYDQQGNDWKGTCQDGLQQSPIELVYSKANVTSIPRIRFYNYDQPLQSPLVLTNNGHTANMVLPPTRNGQRAYINGGLLPGTFEAQSVHFHWGSPNSKGSEHTINYERYDVEMHIVHKNIRYADNTVGEASMFADGLAVLGVMFRAVPRLTSQHSGLVRIFNQLPLITEYNSSTMVNGRLTAGQLLGNIITGRFYSYNGSLTTPDCAESVTWTVFQDVVELPRRQIMKLWNLQDSRRYPLINTYRDIQDTNDRPVYYRNLQ